MPAERTAAVRPVGALLRALLVACACAVAWQAASAQPADAECIECHRDQAKGKTVHKAPRAGCSACHTVADGRTKPHRSTGTLPKAVAAEGDALCHQCHDKSAYDKKFRHRALRSGCTYCHDVHASEHEALLKTDVNAGCVDCHEDDQFQTNAKGRHRALRSGCTYCHDAHASGREKLLKTTVAEQCRDCHDADEFADKARHKPVREGKCTACHTPHAGTHAGLLTKPYRAMCLDCHDRVPQQPHAVTGFPAKGHPTGGEKSGIADPTRKGELLDCWSCHEAHKSGIEGLLRLDGAKQTGFCLRCHKL